MTAQTGAADIAVRATAIVDANAALEGPLLPILHDLQEEFGCVPEEAVPVIANRLNLSRAEVHGVVSFYPDFHHTPSGRHVLKVCRAEACQSMGGEKIADRVRSALGIDWHETTPDGAVTLEPVYCLGLCSCAPAAMLDGEVTGRLDETRLAPLLDEARR
ncbi:MULTISPECIES: formate dehydrogenase subunit gamma [Afifella]|uniref:formate dehydrogenase subunit gamma n=1 Tax=Afifella TaxID=643217 RepID=UPI000FE39B66|nr:MULTISPECIES: formate dehydrogenase subunit gamma [Afifella]MCF1503734.1 formate dehydrogenase subunit gamma [Afifella sp. H1R]